MTELFRGCLAAHLVEMSLPRAVTEASAALLAMTLSGTPIGRCVQVSEVTQRIPGGAFGFYHDFLMTENYYVLLENPMRINLWKLLTKYTTGRACIAECLYMDTDVPMKVRQLQMRTASGGLAFQSCFVFCFVIELQAAHCLHR